MIPILFYEHQREFNTNGIGRLAECVSCKVTEERNGIYECEFQYPITGRRYADIQEERLIVCTHDDKRDRQAFRIYKRSAPINGVVTFYAHHISYDLGNVILEPYTAGNISDAFLGFSIHNMNENVFTFWTNKASVASFKVKNPVSIKSILGGMQGSILDVFGGGEYEWDNFTVKLYQHRGTDSGVTVRYGKNMTDILHETDADGVYNAVVPYYASMGADQTVVCGGVVVGDRAMIISSPFTTHQALRITDADGNDLEFDYTKTRAVPLDLTSEYPDAQNLPTPEELEERAAEILAASDNWAPKDNIKVDFVQLWQTEEYADVAVLQRLSLCDTVSVIYPALGVNAVSQKVIKTVYNVLEDRYDSMEIGTSQSSYAQVVTGQIEQQLENVPTIDVMAEAINAATDLITGGLGGHVVFGLDGNGKPNELYFMDTADVNTAVHVLRINVNGIGFSSTGFNGPYRSAWTLDGAFVADFITAGNINASLITTGTLLASLIKSGRIESVNGLVYFDLDEEEIACSRVITGGIKTTQNRSYPSILDISYKTQYINGFMSDVGTCQIFNQNYRLGAVNIIPGIAESKATISSRKYLRLVADDNELLGYYPQAGIELMAMGVETASADGGLVNIEAGDGTVGNRSYILLTKAWAHISAGTIGIGTGYSSSTGMIVEGAFRVTGSKSRIAETEDYGNRLQYCYETPSPMFGDIGEGQTDASGICVVEIDDVFAETVNNGMEYQVFLQKEGRGDLWVSKKTPAYFIVEGTENLKFAWEIKARQKGYEYERLEAYTGIKDDDAHDWSDDQEAEYLKEIAELTAEQEAIYDEAA